MGLLIENSEIPSRTKIGGLPMDVSGFKWPVCRACSRSMQFVAQIMLSDSTDPIWNSRPESLLIFMCQNDPGMCNDWDANSGGNAVVVATPGSVQIHAPENGETVLPLETFVSLKPYDSSVKDQTDDDNYVDAVNENELVLGKIGGDPLWIQADETPECDCGSRMRFVALLEERGGGGINFGGGGAGYVFACTDCRDKAKFLWQS
ncbi:hypothetical protein VN12_21140 [Pirellula sp. SH-Sr6A]|nr:hypothetical protein VN12_21140 [Pirellula sp. SH-Sr6A]